MSTFDTDFATAAALIEEHFGDTVTLRRGSASTAGVIAVWSEHNAEVLDHQGRTTAVVVRTWSVAASEYVLRGVASEPAEGDFIEPASGDRWQVLPRGKTPAVFLTDDNYWQIQTKRFKRG